MPFICLLHWSLSQDLYTDVFFLCTLLIFSKFSVIYGMYGMRSLIHLQVFFSWGLSNLYKTCCHSCMKIWFIEWWTDRTHTQFYMILVGLYVLRCVWKTDDEYKTVCYVPVFRSVHHKHHMNPRWILQRWWCSSVSQLEIEMKQPTFA